MATLCCSTTGLGELALLSSKGLTLNKLRLTNNHLLTTVYLIGVSAPTLIGLPAETCSFTSNCTAGSRNPIQWSSWRPLEGNKLHPTAQNLILSSASARTPAELSYCTLQPLLTSDLAGNLHLGPLKSETKRTLRWAFVGLVSLRASVPHSKF